MRPSARFGFWGVSTIRIEFLQFAPELLKQSSMAPGIPPPDSAYVYELRLLIKHPSWGVEQISAALGVRPDHSWSAAESGRTETMWCTVSRTEGNRLFFQEVREVIDWLLERRDWVSGLRASAGTVQVIVQLPGAVNIGDSIDAETMLRASELGISIGIEVFPRLTRTSQ
jgi:hypothetical protein